MFIELTISNKNNIIVNTDHIMAVEQTSQKDALRIIMSNGMVIPTTTIYSAILDLLHKNNLSSVDYENSNRNAFKTLRERILSEPISEHAWTLEDLMMNDEELYDFVNKLEDDKLEKFFNKNFNNWQRPLDNVIWDSSVVTAISETDYEA